VEPLTARSGRGIREIELAELSRLRRPDPHSPIPTGRSGDAGHQIDGEWENEPFVVVGVLPDEVHPPRRLKDPRCTVKAATEVESQLLDRPHGVVPLRVTPPS